MADAPKARVQMQGPAGAQWAELVLDGPPLNLFDAAMVADLAAAIDNLPASGARAVLLRAEGKVFCAGVDVKEFLGKDPAAGAALMGSYLAMVQALEALPMPTLAVVHSLCLTIGLELSLGCDLMWAAEEASLGLVEATVGLTPGGGGTQRLVARAGVARAAEAVLTGATYQAEVFREWGVVNRVLPRQELLAAARGHAAELAAGPTFAAGIGKRLLLAARDGGVGAADAITAVHTGLVFPTEDLRAGVESLLADGPGKATYVGR
jgi:enoyl-CoA hydratase/carnithine racemase